MIKIHKEDVLAGFIVFLIALPLSIGIAIAAGAPASAGLLSAILGGIIGTLITGTHITINGPAAGLIVVISSSIIGLSENGDLLLGFKRTLAATMIAGGLQIILGVLRGGRLTFLAPLSVVHGMLAAIGAIIMIKQLPVLLGVTPKAQSIMQLAFEAPNMLLSSNIPVVLISASSVFVILAWKLLPKKIQLYFPAPLVVVVIGLIFSYSMNFEMIHDVDIFSHLFTIGPRFLVHVPKSFDGLFIFPVFDVVTSWQSLLSVTSIFVVCSLETLLSAYAVDKIDPEKRTSNLDLDLIGKGVTNIFCGALGAYPIITGIVRSSANIAYGAKTKWSNFFHGIFLLILVALVPDVINHIPLSSLAALLLFVGLRLAHPRHFLEVWNHGVDQFSLFCVTFVVTIIQDLLVGIAAGVSLKIIFHLIRGVRPRDFFWPKVKLQREGEKFYIEIHSPVVFLGYFEVKKVLEKIEDGTPVLIRDNGYFIDHTIKELLAEYSS